jgi:hypothetical protein
MSNQLLEYVSNQPGTDGHARMGLDGARSILASPEHAQSYIDRFVKDYADHVMKDMPLKDVSDQTASISEGFGREVSGMRVEGEKEIKADWKNETAKIMSEDKEAAMLDKIDPSDREASQNADQVTATVHTTLADRKAHVEASGEQIRQSTLREEAEGKERAGNFLKNTVTGIDSTEHNKVLEDAVVDT